MSSGKAFISAHSSRRAVRRAAFSNLNGRASSSPDQARGDPSAGYVSIAYHVKIPLPIRS
jgi:hypothetical protein